MIQDDGLENTQTDITVVFEGSYANYTLQQSNLTALSLDRTQKSYIVHSLPVDTTLTQLTNEINTASLSAQYLFFSYLSQNYYGAFDSHWNDFISVITSTT
jgi:hypothetical protein